MVLYSALQLEFEVVGAGGQITFVAVDDISILAHPCQDLGLYQHQQNEGETHRLCEIDGD